jgi:phosphate transport system protein
MEEAKARRTARRNVKANVAGPLFLLPKEFAKDAIDALVNHDKELAAKLIEGNSIIDQMEFDIENQCMRLLALQQPMASDLRTIGTCMKIITDFDRQERIADHACNIAGRVIYMVTGEKRKMG